MDKKLNQLVDFFYLNKPYNLVIDKYYLRDLECMGITINGINHEKLQSLLNVAANLQSNYTNDAYRHCIKADALRIQGYYFESIEEYLLSILHEKNNPDAYKGLGFAYRYVGLIDDAIDAFETLKKLTPFDKTVYFELANCYFITSNCCLTIKNLITAIKLDPKYIEAQHKLGLVHENLEDYELAIAIYSKIIEQDPTYTDAYNNLGSLLIKLHRYHQAAKTFKVLLKLTPEQPKAQLGLAVALDKINRHNESIKYYRTYLENKPASANNSHIKKRITALRSGRTGQTRNHLRLV